MTSSQPPSDRYPISFFVGIFLAAAGAVVGAIIGAVESFNRRQPARESPGTTSSSSVPPSDYVSVEQARRQVQGPAIGLLVTGVFNWIVVLPVVTWMLLGSVAELTARVALAASWLLCRFP